MKNGEKKKKSKLHRDWSRLNVSVDPEKHKYLKQIGVNASRLLDKTIFELRKVTQDGLVLISEKMEESWARGDSNARSLPCEGSVITS